MRALVFMTILGCCAIPASSQILLNPDPAACSYYDEIFEEELYGFEADQRVVALAEAIVQVSPEPIEFALRAANVPFAAAVRHGDERLVLYNQRYFHDALRDEGLQWIATTILAHEIAHHVLGHDLPATGPTRRALELEADQFSGQVLYQLGATVQQTERALRDAAQIESSSRYPSREERLEAVRRGWQRGHERGLEFTADSFPYFEWPPPRPSARTSLPLDALLNPGGPTRLVDVATRLEDALDGAGYVDRSYYAVPQGFALVSRLEQITPDGASKPAPERWETSPRPKRVFSLASYFEALLTANPGYYRVIVFVVTPHLITVKKRDIDFDSSKDWTEFGANRLPPSLGIKELTAEYSCTALIYEFEQETRDTQATLKRSSSLTGKDHLVKAKLWGFLGNHEAR